MSLSGKHAFITGGGTGIGLAAARVLAEQGVRLTLAARNFERVEEAASTLDANAVSVDVSDEASVEAAIDAARSRFGGIDILINNAGITPSAPLHKTSLAMWNEVLAINLTGAFLCTRAALPDMIERKGGRVVNVASIAGLMGDMYISAYCASKHGMIGMTRALAKEVARHGITANAVCPGYVETDIVTRAAENIAAKTKLNEDEARASLYAGNPQGRLIQPEEVASMIGWLCSDGAAATNGAALPISGGQI
ncbi:MAG: SDR family oxidoreductase [Hyphomonadaceae bacterium]|nr:SDR family oxidoreductase [Hyphomonadaceae bacterium]